MLQIRDDQISVMEVESEEVFERKAIGLMREGWPDQCIELSDDEMVEIVRPGIARARSFGLDDDNSICKFLNFRFGLGQEFPDRPDDDWAVTILSDGYLSSSEKIDEIFEQIVDRY